MLEFVLDYGEVTLSKVAEEFDVAPSTAHRHLTALHEIGYLTKNSENKFSASLRFLETGSQIRRQKKIYKYSKDVVEKLADETGERVQLCVEDHGKSILIYGKSGDQAIQTDVYLGRRLHLHTNAGGKAILAFLPEDRVSDIVSKYGLPKRTENTVENESELSDELEKIHEAGVAFNDEERIKGLRAIGSAVKNQEEKVLGSISISGPAERMVDNRYKRELPQMLAEATNEVELNIQFDRNVDNFS
jgi:DNA-binding IclR family transcriptional regulator